MTTKIIDLHGNIFKILKGWEFITRVPNLEGYKWAFTRDKITDTELIIAIKGDKARGYQYSLEYGLYIAYHLIRKGYDESKDIRKAYLYGKRQH